MKNIKILLAFIMLVCLNTSCDNDGGKSVIETQEGAIPNFEFRENYPTILDLNVLSEGEHMEFGFSVDIEQGNVASADIIAFYRTAGGDLFGPVTLKNNVTQFPSDFTFTTNELIAAFAELDGLEDFKLGDLLTLTTKLYLSDGRVLDLWDDDGNRLYGSDIHTSSNYSVVANYPVGCPLNGKFTGQYRVTSSGPNSGFGFFSAETFTTTLEEDSQTLRSFDMEYLTGFNFPVSPTLEFICDRVVMSVADAGVGCGGGSITFGSTDDGTTIDFDDESGFTLTITDFLTDGGCGVGSRAVTLKFEKI